MNESELKQKLNDLLNLPHENEVVEFKEAKNNFDFNQLGKYFSALSNEANLKNVDYGWLIFGVTKKHTIVGSAYRMDSKELHSLKQEIAVKTTNQITFIEIYELNLAEGRVVMFQIPAALRGIPVAFEGHWYGRNGESTCPLNMQEIEYIRNQHVLDWSAQIVRSATIEDLDAEAISKARVEYQKKHPRAEVETWNDRQFLNKAKITIQDKITNAALLLLGKEESTHFLLPAIAQISWILKNDSNMEQDYQHFYTPFILAPDRILAKIRNLVYRYMPDNTLFPTEITQYDPDVIREALHNCIAHQDYQLHSRVVVVEYSQLLVFENVGIFLPKTVEAVIKQDAPQMYYRNKFLCDAMINLNMIDTAGSGIKKMFMTQSKRFFPLPEYDLSKSQIVKVTLYGTMLDKNYANILMSQAGKLDLKMIMLLDKIQKKQLISTEEAKYLRSLHLIEGRKPNYFLSFQIADLANEKAKYIKNRGLTDSYYRRLILELIQKYRQVTRQEIDDLLLEKLPQVLTFEQKKNKIKNLLMTLSKKENIIQNISTSTKHPIWTINRK